MNASSWRSRLWYTGAFAALATALYLCAASARRLDMVAYHAVATGVAVVSAACAVAALAGLRSWVGWVNFFAIQWSGWRLYRYCQVVRSGPVGEHLGAWRYGWAWGSWPLTGWWPHSRCTLGRLAR